MSRCRAVAILGLGLLACGGATTRSDDWSHGGSASGPPTSKGGQDAGGKKSGDETDETPTPAGRPSTGGMPNVSGSTSVGGRPTNGGTASAGATGDAAAPSQPVGEGGPCYNDVDCPIAVCGGQVCDWTRQSATPVGDKLFYCTAAGHARQGSDGWCTVDSDCKCFGLGARCVGVYCTFTRPEDAP